jgi:hypothetical protein
MDYSPATVHLRQFNLIIFDVVNAADNDLDHGGVREFCS